MKYFMLSEDGGNSLPMRINSVNLRNVKEAMDGNIEKMDTWNIFSMVTGKETFFPDVLMRPFPLLSKNCFETVSLYCPDIKYKIIKLLDMEQYRCMTYVLPILRKGDYLSEKTEYTNEFRGKFKTIVLERKKIADKAIIRIDDSNSIYIIIRFDLAESILSRKARGIRLDEVLIDKS